jgi:hypothetical protein
MLDIREEIEDMEVDLRCPRGREGFSSLSFENIDIHFMMNYCDCWRRGNRLGCLLLMHG